MRRVCRDAVDIPAGRATRLDKQIPLTVPGRIAAGSWILSEIHAGTSGGAGTFMVGPAIQSEEALGSRRMLTIFSTRPLWLCTGSAERTEAKAIAERVYSTPGGCDEFIPIFSYQKRIPRSDWSGKLFGLSRGERADHVEVRQAHRSLARRCSRCEDTGGMCTVQWTQG